MKEITIQLGDRALEALAQLAKEKGISPEEALAIHLEQQLIWKTRPAVNRGTVQPFRRRD